MAAARVGGVGGVVCRGREVGEEGVRLPDWVRFWR
jgi:hypothetical protein